MNQPPDETALTEPLSPFMRMGYGVAILIWTLGIVLLMQTLPSPNQGWHLHVGSQLLAGKQLYLHISEVNFPFIYYYYAGVHWLANSFNAAPIVVAKLVNGALATLSLMLCTIIVSRSKEHLHTPTTLSTIIGLATGVMLFPFMFSVPLFGEKEHLMVLFIMPLLLYYATTSLVPLAQSTRITIGIMAAIAMALKPFFMFMALAVAVVAWRKKCLAGLLFRTEIATMSLSGLALTLWMVTSHPAYFMDMLPIANYAYVRHPWYVTPLVIFQFLHAFLFVFLVFSWRDIKQQPWLTFIGYYFIAALIMGMVAGLSQEYYLYPAGVLAIILLTYSAMRFLHMLVEGGFFIRSLPRIIDQHYLGFAATVFFIPYMVVSLYIGAGHTIGHSTANSSFALDRLKQHINFGERLMVFGRLPDAFPLVNLTHAEWNWPNSSMWIPTGLEQYRQNHQLAEGEIYLHPTIQASYRRHMQSVIELFTFTPPDVVIVNTQARFTSDTSGKNYGYLEFHLQNPSFSRMFKQYELKHTITSNEQFNFEIYRRKEPIQLKNYPRLYQRIY